MITLGEEQVRAFDLIKSFIKNSDNFTFSLTGSAGTGKSLLISRVTDWLKNSGIDYCLCAPTHKAKTVIEYYTKESAVTLHKLLALSPKLDIINLDFRELQFKMGKPSNNIPYKGVIICDEASMISDDLFKLLLKVCKEYNSKILFVSDKAQLKPVDSNRVSLVYSIKDSFNLTKIYRQDSDNALLPILQTLRESEIDRFETTIGDKGSLICEPNFKKFFNLCKDGIYRAIKDQNIFEAKVLAYTNNRVNNYNKFLTKTLFEDSKEYHRFEILMGYENLDFNGYNFWNSMDYIIVDKPKEIDINIPNFIKLPGYNLSLYDKGNDEVNSIDILSKEIDGSYFESLAQKIEEIRLEAIEAKKYYRSKAWKKYYSTYNSFTTPINLFYNNRVIRKKSFDRGYAITVHKSQGSTFNNVYIDMFDINQCSDIETLRQLQYVSLSRTRNNAYIFTR